MKRSVKNTAIRLISAVVDIFLIFICFKGVCFAVSAMGMSAELHSGILFTMTAAIVFFFAIFGLYDSKEETRANTLVSVCVSVIIVTLCTVIVSLFFSLENDFYILMLLNGLAELIILSAWRMLVSFAAVRFRDKNKILIIESDKVPSRLARKLKYSCTEINEAWYYIIDEDNEAQKSFVLSSLIPRYDIVYISEKLTDNFQNELFYLCTKLNITVNMLANPSNVSLMGSKIFQFADTPVMEIPSMRLTRSQKFVKRIFDVLIAAVGLIISSPLFIVIPIAIKLDSKGPVFYFQERYTINKKRFMLCKFRTMRTDAEKFGAQFAGQDDPRVTKVGNILRKLRLDELPQFINILSGAMSVVGPRPERPVFADEYCDIVKNYEMRYFVKAGLTGYAQIYGRYSTRASDKILMDMIYAIKYSFWLDIKLIILTVKTMFVKESTEGVDEERDKLLNSKEKEDERRKNLPFSELEKEFCGNENFSYNARL